MAKKTESPEPEPESVVVKAAKAIGEAAGKIAAAVGTKPQAKSPKVPKLEKKNKRRLPRRQKKAARKAEEAKRRA